MRKGKVKEAVKEFDDVLHIVTGHRVPYWGKKAWEALRSAKGTQGVIAATQAIDDPYVILGVDGHARPADVVSKYRELAHKYHPDGTDPDIEKFKQVQKAYEEITKEWK